MNDAIAEAVAKEIKERLDAIGEESENFKMVVSGAHLPETHFKLKFVTLFGKLKQHYADRNKISTDSFHLFYKGKLIKDDDTPDRLGMKEGAVVEARTTEEIAYGLVKKQQQLQKGQEKLEKKDQQSIMDDAIAYAIAKDIKEALAAEESEYFKMVVRSAHLPESHCRLKFVTRLGELKQNYANRNKISTDSFNFFYKGKLIKDDDTPDRLGMKEGDVVESIMDESVAKEAAKTEKSDEVQFIKLIVFGLGEGEVHFKMKNKTRMIRMKQYYADIKKAPMKYFRIFYKGVVIEDDDTPLLLGMKDDDEIEAKTLLEIEVEKKMEAERLKELEKKEKHALENLEKGKRKPMSRAAMSRNEKRKVMKAEKRRTRMNRRNNEINRDYDGYDYDDDRVPCIPNDHGQEGHVCCCHCALHKCVEEPTVQDEVHSNDEPVLYGKALLATLPMENGAYVLDIETAKRLQREPMYDYLLQPPYARRRGEK